MVTLFDCSIDNISLHLKNIFKEVELKEDSVTEDFSTTAADGKNYKTRHYNLDAVIAVGYRVNSRRATQFRQWTTGILRDFAIRGYVLDKERLKLTNASLRARFGVGEKNKAAVSRYIREAVKGGMIKPFDEDAARNDSDQYL